MDDDVNAVIESWWIDGLGIHVFDSAFLWLCLSQVDGGGSGGMQMVTGEKEDAVDSGCLDIAPDKLCIGLSFLICLLAYSIRNANNNNNNNRHR